MSRKKIKRLKQLTCGIAVIHDAAGRLLVSKRKKLDSYGGYWEFPGGKKRPRESLRTCVSREAKEELGVTVYVKHFLKRIVYVYPDRSVSLHFYLCTIKKGVPRLLACDALRWVTLAECRKLHFLPASLPILQLIGGI